MKTLKKIVFTGLLALIACAGVAQAQELYKDEKAPMHERIMDLLSRLTVEEKSACCVQPLRVFLVWIFPNITTVTKRFTEWFVRDALLFPSGYRTGGNLESGIAIAGGYGYF